MKDVCRLLSVMAAVMVFALCQCGSDSRLESAKGGPRAMAPVRIGTKWGYIGPTGALCIPARFDDAWVFSEGLASVGIDDRWVYIDTTGRQVLDKSSDGRVFEYASFFCDGLACVGVDDGSGSMQCGFIDKSGRFVISPRFESCGDFSEGLAPARSLGKWGFINAAGDFSVMAQFERVGHFHEGLAAAMSSGKWGYVDTTGAFVVAPQYAAVSPVTHGLSAVQLPSEGAFVGEGGYINRTGEFVIAPQYMQVGTFGHGLAPVMTQDGQPHWSYIDMSGREVIAPLFDGAQPFSGGLAAVMTGLEHDPNAMLQKERRGLPLGLWGFIDTTGVMVIEPRFKQEDIWFFTFVSSTYRRF
jgi:hypothetical protein